MRQNIQESILDNEDHSIYRILQYVIWTGFAVMAYLICRKIRYSDGDDAFFYKMAHSMGFFEYVRYRYITWQGRVTSEAMTYLAFRMGIEVWRVLNAGMLTLLPAGIVHLTKKFMGEMSEKRKFYLACMTCLGILFMDMDVIGYSSIWMTGSTFYLWSVVCGIWALMPIADLAVTGEWHSRSYLISIPLGLIASMGLEQIAAVDIAFGLIAVGVHYWKKKEVAIWPLLQTVLIIIGLMILFVSPGTAARSADEITTWMPQFATMSTGEHLFLIIQYICSALANQTRMYLIAMWIMMAVLYHEKKGWKKKLSLVHAGLILTAVWSYTGHHTLSEMGIGVKDITKCVTEVATWDTITPSNRIAIVWWCIVIFLQLFLIWNLYDEMFDKIFMELIFLGGLACAGIMYFTPTIYASGGRVLFMTNVMCWSMLALLFREFKGRRYYRWIIGVFIVCGLIQVASGFAHMRSFL